MAGRYRILEELGKGGAGAVFKAYDTQLDRYVALKRLLSKEEEQTQDTQSSGLKKEAASLATLQHPNIVSVYDLGSDDDGMFIVMELLEGDTLSDWIQSSAMGVADFYELASQTLEGILSAHGQSILHRDLKPENIKIKRQPGGRLQVKIVDFGLARLAYGARKQTEDQRGNILGSIFYMAPEQFLRRPLDGRTDLYSLGCVYYQALSGRRPFQSQTIAGVMDLHLKHEVPLLHDLCPHLPERVCDWVMWLMNREPADRPANAQAALDSLRVIAAEGAFNGSSAGSAPAARISTGGIGRPPTGGMVPTRTTGSAPRPSTSHVPQRPTVAAPDYSAYQAITPPKKSLAWLYIILVLAAAGGGWFAWQKMHAAGGGGKPVEAKVENKPQEQSDDLIFPGAIIHWRAGDKTEAWADSGGAPQPVRPNDRVLTCHDLLPDTGDSILSAPERKKEACPKYVFEQPVEFTHHVGFLRFESGNAMLHRIDKNNPTSKGYPFGDNVKNMGFAMFFIARPNITEKEVRLVQVRNQDGRAWLQVTAYPNNEFHAKVSVRQPDGKDIVKECNAKGRSVKQFSLISVRWDPPAKKVILVVRSSGDGGKTRADCDTPPNCPLLNEVHFSESAAQKPAPEATFTGDLLEFILWPRVMNQDDHADQAQKLAEFYFKKPGVKWP